MINRRNILKHMGNYIEQASFITASMGDLICALEDQEKETGIAELPYFLMDLLIEAEDAIGDAIVNLDKIESALENALEAAERREEE